MPIGKSEIVLKVQKCIPSRVGVHPDKKVVRRNFSALTVQAISQVIKLYIPIHLTTTNMESLNVLLLWVCGFPTTKRGL